MTLFLVLSRFPNDAKKSTNESKTEGLRRKNEALTRVYILGFQSKNMHLGVSTYRLRVLVT